MTGTSPSAIVDEHGLVLGRAPRRPAAPAQSGSTIASSMSCAAPRRALGPPRCRDVARGLGRHGRMLAGGRRGAHLAAQRAAYHRRAWRRLAPVRPRSGPGRPRPPRSARRGLTPSGRARSPVAWALYDFANTIFSFAVVSDAIGPVAGRAGAVRRARRAAAPVVAIVVSVGINALVSPILGAISRPGGRRLPFLLFFTAAVHRRDVFIADVPALSGLALFIVANFAYQAALIYYDATLKTVSYAGDPRPDVRDRRRASATAARSSSAWLIFLLDIPVVDRASAWPRSCSLVFAIPIFLVVHEPAPKTPHGLTGRGRRGVVRRSSARTIEHARTVPGPRPVPRRPVLLLGRGQHRDRGHERGRDQGHRRHRARRLT